MFIIRYIRIESKVFNSIFQLWISRIYHPDSLLHFCKFKQVYRLCNIYKSEK